MSDRWDEVAKETWSKMLGFGLANLGRKTATDIIAQALRNAVGEENERCAKAALAVRFHEPTAPIPSFEAQKIADVIRSRTTESTR